MKKLDTRMAGILIFILIWGLFGFLGIFWILSGNNVPNSFYWGIIFAILPGIATWYHLRETWNPKVLQPKGGRKTLDAKWIPVVVLSGMFVARIFEDILPVDVSQMITGFISTWLFMTTGYLIIQAWMHR